VNLGSVMALSAAAVNFSMTVLQVAVARVPGWRIARLFAAIAFTAGMYNVLSALLCVSGFSAAEYAWFGRLIYLVVSVNAPLWLIYAYGDREGSVRAAPSAVRWLIGLTPCAGLFFAVTGGLLQARVAMVDLRWAHVRYFYPITTRLGDLFSGLLAVTGALALFQLFHRYRAGERALRLQLVFFAFFSICAIDQVLVANRQLQFPSLLDLGFVLIVLPLSMQTLQRIVFTARKLHEPSNQLETEVAPGTEARDHAEDALPAAEQDVRTLVASLDAIVWEAEGESLAVSFVSQGAERLLGYQAGEADQMSVFWSRFLHPEDRIRVMTAAREALRSGKGTSLEYRVLTADGRLRWFRDSLCPVPGRAGAPGRLRGVMVDVTESHHIHDALLASEALFRTLFENATIGIYRTTPDGRILTVNPALLRLLGYDSFEEMSRRNLEEGGFEPSYPRSDFRRRLDEGGIVQGMEAAWTRRDGSVVFIRESARAVKAADGAVLYYDGVVEDVTESHRAHEALLESEERFRIIFQHAAVGAALVDVEGRMLVVNDRYCEITGHSREQLVGKSFHAITHPDDQGIQEDGLRALLNGTIPKFSLEKRYIGADGAMRWGRLFISLVRDREGTPKHFVGVVEDITESKLAEAALIESERRFREMADSAPAMIWTSDREGHAIFFNRQALTFTGCAMEHLAGRGWVDFVHPEDLKRLQSSFAVMRHSHGSGETEFRVRRADGAYRWLLAIAIPRFDGAEYVGHIGINVDITELKRNHEQIAASQKLESLGVLAGGIAHDFNNLLGSILAESELLLDYFTESSSEREGIERIQTVARRASEIVRQMMAFAGRETTALEPLDVSALIGELLGLLKVSISKRAVLSVNLATGLPAVRANAAGVRQVVMNLITNASEALEDRAGTITVATSLVRIAKDPELPAGDYVRLEVSDTGSGMTPAVQSRIFDPFFTTKFTGRGLGLPAAQGIVKGHGGAIRFASAPGAGTRFEVLLPRAAAAVQIREKAVAAAAPLAGSLRRKVLIVEDEEALRMAVSKMLHKRGFEVIEAGDGQTALDIIQKHREEIGAVLLDMTLPGMNGGEVFTDLCRTSPEIKVILTTAYSQDVAFTAAGDTRPWGFIRKPYQIGPLENLLRDALSPSVENAAN